MHVPPIERAAGSMTSGPTGLKIDWFETQPSPDFDRLAPASRGRESKMLFHQRNKKVVAAMTQNRPLHDHSPSPSASAFVIDRAPAFAVPNSGLCGMGHSPSSFRVRCPSMALEASSASVSVSKGEPPTLMARLL